MNRTAKILSVLLGVGLVAAIAWAQAAPGSAAPAPRPVTPGTPGPGPTSRPAMNPMMMQPNMGMPTTLPAADEWIFTLNGKKYTEAEVEKTFRMFTPPGRTPNDDMAKRMLQAQYRQVLDRTIDNILMENEADKLKIAVTEADVDAQGEKLIARFLKSSGMTRAEFADQVQKRGGMSLDETLKSMRPGMRMQVFMEKLAKELFKDVKVTDEEIKQRFDNNPTYNAQVRASHILLSSSNPRQGMTPEEREAAKKKADEVVVKAKAPGADFAALAKEFSVDKAANEKGGDLGFFGPKGPMDPTFTAAAFGLKVGEVSNVVETRFGFHIIKLTDTRPAKTLEDARAEIADEIKDQKRQTDLQNWLKETRTAAKIEYAPGHEPATRPAMPPMMPMQTRPPATTTRPAAGPNGQPPAPRPVLPPAPPKAN